MHWYLGFSKSIGVCHPKSIIMCHIEIGWVTNALRLSDFHMKIHQEWATQTSSSYFWLLYCLLSYAWWTKSFTSWDRSKPCNWRDIYLHKFILCQFVAGFVSSHGTLYSSLQFATHNDRSVFCPRICCCYLQRREAQAWISLAPIAWFFSILNLGETCGKWFFGRMRWWFVGCDTNGNREPEE